MDTEKALGRAINILIIEHEMCASEVSRELGISVGEVMRLSELDYDAYKAEN